MSMDMKVESWNGHAIRFVWRNGYWIGIAKDIADALGYSDTAAMTRHIREKYVIPVKLTGMNMTHTGLTEQGIYKAIMRSQRPEAEEFEDWVFCTIQVLREAIGFEGFQVFRMLDREHQKAAIDKLNNGLAAPTKIDFIKANTIANKAVSNLFGYSKMVKKPDMTPDMLLKRQQILDDTAELMTVKEKHDLDLSVSGLIYGKYKAV